MKIKLIQFNKDAGGAGGESDALPFDQVENLEKVVSGADSAKTTEGEEPEGEEQDSGVDPDEQDLSDTSASDDKNDSEDDEDDENDDDGDDASDAKKQKQDPKKKEEPKNLEVLDEDDDEDPNKKEPDPKKEKSEVDEGAAAEEEEELTWVSTAKALDISVEEDSYEAFTTAVKSTITKLKEENEALKTNPIKAIDDQALALTFGPEGAFAVKYLMKGGKINDLINPVSGFEKELDMSDREKVLNDFIKQGFDPEDAEKEVVFLEESERFDAYAKKVNRILNEKHVKAIEEKLKNVVDGVAKEKEDFVALSNREEQLIVDEINARDNIHDLKITKEAKDKIIQKLKSGDYRKRLRTDPKFLVDMILNYEFSKTAVKKVAEKTAQAVTSQKTKEFTEKVFKVPGDGKKSSGRAVNTKASEVPKELEGFQKFDSNVKVGLV